MNSHNKEVREQFARIVAKREERVFRHLLILSPFGLTFFYLVFFQTKYPILAISTFGIFFGGLIVSSLLLPKLMCPACKKNVDGEIVRFCAECGAEDIQFKGPDGYYYLRAQWPRCRGCNKSSPEAADRNDFIKSGSALAAGASARRGSVKTPVCERQS